MQVPCTDTIEEIVGENCEVKTARRCKRIRKVRRRLAEGWYDRDDLLDAVIERILIDMALA